MSPSPASAGTGAALGRLRSMLLGTALRGAGAMLVLLLLASLVFFALRLLPGDPAALVLGDQAGEEELALLRSKLALDLHGTVYRINNAAKLCKNIVSR